MKPLPKLKQVQFDTQSNAYGYFAMKPDQLHHFPQIELRTNLPFTKQLQFDEFQNWRGNHKPWLKDAGGVKYPMFISDFPDLIQHGFLPGGYITGTWAFRKSGSMYGLVLLG